MSRAFFITHPEVVVDPSIAVERWHLADRGIERMRAFARSPVMEQVASVSASTETKAIEAAGILAAWRGIGVRTCIDLGENDRRATGFLPPAEFEAVADAFFARPETSVRGWERASDAQARICRAVESVITNAPEGDLAIVAHGAVGALLYCAYSGCRISRAADQPSQGHFWAFEAGSRRVLHGWKPIA